MPDESNVLSRIGWWAVCAAVLCLAIVLYFRVGTRVQPLTAPAAAAAADSSR